MPSNKPPKRFKIGIICEGQDGGADMNVLRRIIDLICPHATPSINPLTIRPKVLTDAPKAASQLLNDGCVLVFIVWDVFPTWRDEGTTSDCEDHRKELDANLDAGNVDRNKICAIAIHEELEAWLLADGDALSAAMSTTGHPVKIGHEKRPDQISNPKKKLRKLFQTKKVGTYNESFHAAKIAKHWTSTKRLERSQSFRRFAARLRAVCDEQA